MDSNPSRCRGANFRSNLLGNDICHGPRRQLWSIQHGIQRLPSWSPLAGHSWQETHSRAAARLCTRKSPNHHHRNGGWMCNSHHPDIRCENQQTFRFIMAVKVVIDLHTSYLMTFQFSQSNSDALAPDINSTQKKILTGGNSALEPMTSGCILVGWRR